VGTTSFSCTAVDGAQQKASCNSSVVVAAPSQPAPTTQPAPAPAPQPDPKPTPPGHDKDRDGRDDRDSNPTPSAPETGVAPQPTPTTSEPQPTTEPTPTLGPAPGSVMLVCPTIAPVKEDSQSGKAVVQFADPIFSDGTVPVTVSCSPKSGSQFRIGNTTVACSATNVAQELFSCTTTVTVTDRPKLSNEGGL
jgi:hypothetical protein